eukprot:365486-Chlamydomonas_euryale.AAC.6
MDAEGTRWPKAVSHALHTRLRETTESTPGAPILPAASVSPACLGGEARAEDGHMRCQHLSALRLKSTCTHF